MKNNVETLAFASAGSVRMARPAPTTGTVIGIGPTDPAFAATMRAPVESASEETAPPSRPLALRTTVLPQIVLDDAQPVLRHETRPRYRPLASLGAGGCGEVALATDEDIGRQVAIKRLRNDEDRASVLRFVDEIRVMGQLDHPNIVAIHDVGNDDDGSLYFVMKEIAGDTLEAIIERLRDGDPMLHARYPIAVRVQIFLAILRAVQFAHARRIVHRDIKPANVIVGAFGEVALIDWGIAKRLDDPLSEAIDAFAPAPDGPDGDAPHRRFRTRVGALLGTPAYMAPEQARGDNHLVDERSDLYSLSVLFYELLTLRHPLGDLTDLASVLEGVRQRQPPLACFVRQAHQQGVSMELATFVAKGLAKQPEERFASASEMIERLQRIVTGDFAVSCPVTLTKRAIVALGRAVDANPRLVFMGLPLIGLLTLAAAAVILARLIV